VDKYTGIVTTYGKPPLKRNTWTDEAMRQEWMKRENMTRSTVYTIVFNYGMCCWNRLAGQRKSECPLLERVPGVRCRSGYYDCVRDFDGTPLDHFELYRCRDDKSFTLVSHPYEEPREDMIRFIEASFPLRATVYPKEMSWYFPGRTYRFEIRQRLPEWLEVQK